MVSKLLNNKLLSCLLLLLLMAADASAQKKKEVSIAFVNTASAYPFSQFGKLFSQGYFDLYNNNTIVNVSNLVTGSGNGYGGIYSNVFDLQTFENALFIQQTLLSQKSLAIMQTYGKSDGSNYYGYGLQKSYIQQNGDYGIGHKGRDLGYSANLFYFPQNGVTHIFFVNYGTDAESGLKDMFRSFVDELVTLTVE